MNLQTFFEIQFNLLHIQKYSISEIQDMMPWERDIHVDALREYIKAENLKSQNEQRRY